MHKTVVFLETTLTHQEAILLFPRATYQPSVKMGDVLRAIKEGYQRIVIIDGNFSWTPSVWHKEILTALDYGLEVWGAASMGALRASELDVFGMKGHGCIYEMYKNEEVEGDDEVALVYSNYNNTQTLPLINIRLTVKELSITNKESILNSIRSIFYADRTWENIEKHLSDEQYHLIKSNYRDAKKEDTQSLLLYLNQQPSPSIATSLNKKNREFTFFEKKLIESTFSPVWSHSPAHEQNPGEANLQRAENILGLLSIPSTQTNRYYYQSLLTMLDLQTDIITEYELMYQVEQFREKYNLLKGEDFFNWLQYRKLHDINLEQLFTDYVKLSKHLILTYDFNNYFS